MNLQKLAAKRYSKVPISNSQLYVEGPHIALEPDSMEYQYDYFRLKRSIRSSTKILDALVHPPLLVNVDMNASEHHHLEIDIMNTVRLSSLPELPSSILSHPISIHHPNLTLSLCTNEFVTKALWRLVDFRACEDMPGNCSRRGKGCIR